jgi:hypothetical protein
MTSFTRFRERSRDVQDHIERHVWGEQKYISKSGSIIKVRGTDTKDEETAVTVVGSGTSFNLKKDHNSEVFLLAGGSDTTLKLALLTIPRDKQRRWKEEHGGVQNPLDDEWALDFGKEKAHITKKEFAVGKDGEFEITKDKNVYFRLDGDKKFIIDGELIVNKRIKTPVIVNGKEKIPGFQGNEQAQASDDDSSGGGGGGGGGGVASFQAEEPRDVMGDVVEAIRALKNALTWLPKNLPAEVRAEFNSLHTAIGEATHG